MTEVSFISESFESRETQNTPAVPTIHHMLWFQIPRRCFPKP